MKVSWIRTLVSNLLKKLTKLLTRRRQPDTEPAPGVLTELDKKLGAEIQKRQARERRVDTSQGGPNMPRSQPCPRCHRRSKRVEKTVGGANYRCPEHGKFFVKAPGL